MEDKGDINVCLVIGDPVNQSLSPLLHTTGYQALGITNSYVYESRTVKAEELEQAIADIRAQRIKGVSVTIPHKVKVAKFLDEVDEEARAIGAVNTIVNKAGRLIGKNTDWIGVLKPLQRIMMNLSEKKVALIGAGGAARAACYALKMSAANVTIYNRTLSKAQEIGDFFTCAARDLSTLSTLDPYDIIINTIPYNSVTGPLPFNPDLIRDKHIMFDMTYFPHRTALIDKAISKKAKVIYGIEMLIEQGLEQFRVFTGQNPPDKEIREAMMPKSK